MNKFKIYTNQNDCFVSFDVETMTFPGGERHVRLQCPPDLNRTGIWTIYAPMYTPEAVMDLMLIHDALSRVLSPQASIRLFMPYVPYARQDRVALPGEALSAKVFCNLVNGLNFDLVTIADPHSDVVSALLNRVEVESAIDSMVKAFSGREDLLEGCAFVAPDAGARKRVEKAAAFYDVPVVYGGKSRDPKTGALSNFYVEGEVPDRPLIIVDDICDGGGTFIALTKVLRERTSQPIYLYVTHGLFTKGEQVLKDAGITDVFSAYRPHLDPFDKK